MVFLRLTIKILLQEQLLTYGLPKVTSSTDNSHKGGVKVVTFMVPVHQPEEVTLGALAALIHDQWGQLRPNSGPLKILKILNDAHPGENLSVKLTVADVFVDHGRAAADGRDQRAIARVIQRSFQPIFDRESSVTQDWDTAGVNNCASTQQRTRSLQGLEPKVLTTVDENELFPSLAKDATEDSGVQIDVPVKSVEHEHAATPIEHSEPPLRSSSSGASDNESDNNALLRNREASEELGTLVPHSFGQDVSQRDPFIDEEHETESIVGYSTPPEAPAAHCSPTPDAQQKDIPDSENDKGGNNVYSDAEDNIDMVDSIEESVQQQKTTGKSNVPMAVIEKKNDFESKALQVALTKRKRSSSGVLPLTKWPRSRSTMTTPHRDEVASGNQSTPVRVRIPDTPTPIQHKRPRSFSSPQKGLDFSNRPPNVPAGSMGLGFTSSPGVRPINLGVTSKEAPTFEKGYPDTPKSPHSLAIPPPAPEETTINTVNKSTPLSMAKSPSEKRKQDAGQAENLKRKTPPTKTKKGNKKQKTTVVDRATDKTREKHSASFSKPDSRKGNSTASKNTSKLPAGSPTLTSSARRTPSSQASTVCPRDALPPKTTERLRKKASKISAEKANKKKSISKSMPSIRHIRRIDRELFGTEDRGADPLSSESEDDTSSDED